MLHDLLFAIQGISGDLFVIPKDAKEGLVAVPWLSDGESSQSLALIKDFGIPCRRVKDFIRSNSIANLKQQQIMTKEEVIYSLDDLYRETFRQALKCVIAEYLDKLTELETALTSSKSTFLNGPGINGGQIDVIPRGSCQPLAAIRIKLSAFRWFFSSVGPLLDAVDVDQSEPPFGVRLLRELYKLVRIEPDQNLQFTKIYISCRQVFLERLGNLLSAPNSTDSGSPSSDELVAKDFPHFVDADLHQQILEAIKKLRHMKSSKTWKPSATGSVVDEGSQSWPELDVTIPFSAEEFSTILTNRLSDINRQFISYLEMEIHLKSHVERFHEIYLTANGEFFEKLFEVLLARSSLTCSPLNSLDFDEGWLNRVFYLSIMQMDDVSIEDGYRRFEFCRAQTQSETKSNNRKQSQRRNKIIGGYQLVYKMQDEKEISAFRWVLDGEKDFNRLNETFQILFSLKLNLFQFLQSVKGVDLHGDRMFWIQRNQMINLLQQILNDYQRDTIEVLHGRWAGGDLELSDYLKQVHAAVVGGGKSKIVDKVLDLSDKMISCLLMTSSPETDGNKKDQSDQKEREHVERDNDLLRELKVMSDLLMTTSGGGAGGGGVGRGVNLFHN